MENRDKLTATLNQKSLHHPKIGLKQSLNYFKKPIKQVSFFISLARIKTFST